MRKKQKIMLNKSLAIMYFFFSILFFALALHFTIIDAILFAILMDLALYFVLIEFFLHMRRWGK
jgi:hypothetical protein